MSWSQYWIIFLSCALLILICRVIPYFMLKGRELPEAVKQALSLIPPAAFAALVANDVINPGMFNAGLWPAGAIVVASVCVIVVAVLSKSLLWSAIAGVAIYAILLLIV